MLSSKNSILGVIVPNGIIVILTTSSQVDCSKLPELIHGDICVIKNSLLPRNLDFGVVVRRWWTTVLFQNNGLACFGTSTVVLGDPG